MTIYRFSWDPPKERLNRRNHKLAFADAALVFRDPLRISRQDRVEGGEVRWQTTGTIGGVTVILVAHLLNDNDDGTEWVHIISARRLTRKERKRYEQERDD